LHALPQQEQAARREEDSCCSLGRIEAGAELPGDNCLQVVGLKGLNAYSPTPPRNMSNHHGPRLFGAVQQAQHCILSHCSQAHGILSSWACAVGAAAVLAARRSFRASFFCLKSQKQSTCH